MTSWSLKSMMVATATRGDRSISLSIGEVTPTRWIILIVEAASNEASPRAVLDNHAHESLEARSLPAAMKLAERYAKWWRGSRATHFKCGCEPIKSECEDPTSPST